MRDRWIPDSSKFHKPIDEDSANEDALFVCGIFFMGIKKWGVIYGRNQAEILGRSAHGSAPDQGKDAIVAAAAVVMGLQTLSSRGNDPQNTFVLTVGMMNAEPRATSSLMKSSSSAPPVLSTSTKTPSRMAAPSMHVCHRLPEKTRETLIKSLFDLTLIFSCNARNTPTRIASYLRRSMTKHCMKIHVKSNSAI